ncbi:hypothetical protein ACIA59_10225 [Micromonospora haikouensis]|uniref:hypothetical protein n=1 Tax=Micromonospora haikouensis TaxID=686309 RepID=UPI00379A63DD
MTTTDPLDSHYLQLEDGINVSETGDYATLVTPNGNSSQPVHRWFHFKEAFSHRLLSRVIKDEELAVRGDGFQVFDPFAGSATTAVSLAQIAQEGTITSARFFGTECNPFLHILGSGKVAALSKPPSNFEEFAKTVASAAAHERLSPSAGIALSTFHKESYFPQANVERLLKLRSACDRLSEAADETTQLLAATCLATSVEPASRLRRDGRTLRFSPSKVPLDPTAVFMGTAQRIKEDLPKEPVRIHANISLADIRDNSSDNQLTDIDLALFSPPYPNNIDYTEVYKLELWALGLVDSNDAFTSQRRRTLRSHGSLKWDDEYAYKLQPFGVEIDKTLDPILKAIPRSDRYTQYRRQLVMGYVDDMLRVVSKVHGALRPGGVMACVVGNSLHGNPGEQVLIAADLLIAHMAMLVGMDVTRIEVARRPKRRITQSDYLRESIVFARKRIS